MNKILKKKSDCEKKDTKTTRNYLDTQQTNLLCFPTFLDNLHNL